MDQLHLNDEGMPTRPTVPSKLQAAIRVSVLGAHLWLTP